MIAQNKIKWTSILVIATGMLFSCGQNRAEIEEISNEDMGPPESLDTVKMTLYSMGDAKAILTAPKIERQKYPDKTLFPEGLNVVRYDSTGAVESTLSAMRGELSEKAGLMELFGDVQMKNHINSQALYTEYLISERKNDTTFLETNQYVRIFDGDDTHESNGAITDDQFSFYDFKDYIGVIEPDSTTTPK